MRLRGSQLGRCACHLRVVLRRQRRCVRHVCRLATRCRLVLDTFRLTADAQVRSLQPGEVRVVRRGDTRDVAWLVNPAARTAVQVLPDCLEDSSPMNIFYLMCL